MADEVTTTSEVNPAPPGAPTEAQVDPVEQWLATATPEQILKHNKIGGIVGSRLQQERARVRQELQDEQQAIAMQRAQEDLDKLAVEDPDEFARRYLSSKEQERIKQSEQVIKAGVRGEFAQKIGENIRSIAEFGELTPEEFGRLQQAVVGKSDDEAIAAFNAAAIDVIADRRSQKRVQDWRTKDLAKEREAIRAEEAAKGLATSQRPDMGRGVQPAPFDPTKLPPKEFDNWYRQNFLGRR